MSIRLMTLVWDIRWPTQNHLLVMLKLADHANDEGGRVWPAVATIASQAQCSERTVQNVLKALRDCGLAEVVKTGGGQTPTVYALNVAMLQALSGRTLEGCADRIELPVDIYEPTGATVAPLAVAPVQPETGGGAKLLHRGGAKLLHPNHQEPPREPSLGKNSNFDLGSAVEKPSKALPCFVITPADTPWDKWIEHLRATDRGDIAFDATQRKRIKVSSRFPKSDSVVFEPVAKASDAQRKRAAAKDYSDTLDGADKPKRITGDAA